MSQALGSELFLLGCSRSSMCRAGVSIVAVAACWSPSGEWMASGHAQQTGASGSSQPLAAESGALVPYQFVPSPRWTPPASAPAGTDAPKRPAAQQKVFDAYIAGNYALVVKEGPGIVAEGKVDEQLRFFVANSLAWSGHLEQAIAIYKGLLNSPFKAEAQLGLGNVYRWRNQDHQAVTYYADVLRATPKNEDAQTGMRLVQRELRPRTTITAGGTHDIAPTDTRSVVLNHRWRERDQSNIWEVETGLYRTENSAVLVSQGDVAVRYKALERKFRPQVELSTNGKTVFGNLTVEAGGLPLVMDVGRLNWARASNNANGLANGVTATRVGVRASKPFALGTVMGRFDAHRVSDGNTVLTSAIRYWPSWRPLGSNFKPILSVETRDVKFATPDYWSPAQGYASFNAGVLAEWAKQDWYLYSSVQRGWRISGEAGASWSASLAGKRWLSDELALGANFWAMGSKRNGAPYKAHSFYVTAERLWE